MKNILICIVFLISFNTEVIAEPETLTTAEYKTISQKCYKHLKLANIKLANACYKSLLNEPAIKNNISFYTHLLTNYANSLVLAKKYKESSTIYKLAIELSTSSEHHELLPHLHGNYAITNIHLKKYDKAFELINEIPLNSISYNKNSSRLHLQYSDILLNLLTHSNLDIKPLAKSTLYHVDSILNKQHQKPLSTTNALIKKAELYQLNHQYQVAQSLLQDALVIAQKHGFTHLVFKAQWRLARVLNIMGKQQQSIDYYAMSIDELNNSSITLTTRTDSLLPNTQPASNIYIEYADLLLTITPGITDSAIKQNYLQTARTAIERSKAADLQDFFKDQCVDNTRQKIKQLDSTLKDGIAALYPIVFNDRLELLLSTNNGITQFTQYITKNELQKLSNSLRSQLEKRKSRSYLKTSNTLYNIIISPIESTLLQNNITTLINIPGEGLHGLAFSALHNGSEFLIEKYALVISPGLELTDPELSPHSTTKILLSGISVPVQGFPALKYVQSELSNINKHYKSEVLINNEFSAQSFSDALFKKKLTIAHIATHGEFGDNIDQSYILAHDSKISVNELSNYIGFNRFRDTPLELLTLSACYTAAGNDKAALGLAGITVKSGARSALATLWPVNDKATTILMEQFYNSLENNIGKAESLRRAQLALIANIQYRHPGYWAPFILIGNWN